MEQAKQTYAEKFRQAVTEGSRPLEDNKWGPIISEVHQELADVKAMFEKRQAPDGKLHTKASYTKADYTGEWEDLEPSGGHREAWNLRDALSKQLGEIVTAALEPSVPGQSKKDAFLDLALARAVGKAGSIALIKAVLEDADVISTLATSVYTTAVHMSHAAAATGDDLNSKYVEEGAFELAFGAKSDFFAGLEPRIGLPSVQIMNTMIQEHCDSCDSTKQWTSGNYGISTTPRTEFRLVAQECVKEFDQMISDGEALPAEWRASRDSLVETCPDLLHNDFEWPQETKNVHHARAQNKSSGFLGYLHHTMNMRLADSHERVLLFPEALALRLYTGPLFEKYNSVCRGGSLTGDSVAFMKEKFEELCGGGDGEVNRYTTTIYVVTSALIKASKLTKAETVYRGMAGGTLPKQFWESDASGVKGGVEFAFMSTTTNREVAFQYAAGSASTVLKIETGMIDKGADLGWISQYPHEREICFPPLTSMQVMGTHVEDAVLVINLRLNLNLTVGTIEDVISKRRKVRAALSGLLNQSKIV